ncbi:low affinity iron permease family protein [Taklimakanibacter deserti]|uniref:low affinity iron permease family protein n=1 Tax=Taklimakanibacter deserti TaxID=2267839 RepID=UPI0034D6FF7A
MADRSSKMSDLFSKFANQVAWAAGSPITFSIAFLTLLAWAASGPYFGYSQGWQLLVNTGTTITTFLMVFVIQNSQNRDGLAAQIKLDEIIRGVKGAKNSMIDLECLTDQELADLRVKFAQIADVARADEKKVTKARRFNGAHLSGSKKRGPRRKAAREQRASAE